MTTENRTAQPSAATDEEAQGPSGPPDHRPSFRFAAFSLLAVLVVLGVSVFVLALPTIVAILLAFLTAFVAGLLLRLPYERVQGFAFDSVRQGMSPLFIITAVGAMIGAWITSGTVPTIVFFGLHVLSPDHLLVGTVLLCILTSMATGTSYGTVGTVGIALVAVAHGMQVPLAPVAGAIVCGAWFGDKMSPLSDSTNLSSAMAGVDLVAHIRHLLWTTVPAVAVSLGLFAFLDARRTTTSGSAAAARQLSAELQAHFHTSPVTLAPAVLVIVLLALRRPAFLSIVAGALCAVPVAVLVQGASPATALASLGTGYTRQTGDKVVDTLLVQGGVEGMMPTVGIMMLALAMAGVLGRSGILAALLERVVHTVSNRRRLMVTSVFVTLLSASISNSSSSHVISGNLLRPLYDRYGVDRRNLSRILEDNATCATAAMPWVDSAVYVSATLGVAATAYAPYAVFCLLSPVISLFWAVTGLTVTGAGESEKAVADAV
ncbi:Na+/H+ antiporter NhaC [Streptomyces sp. NPDC059740]|uniref:Na+/H+ antiporter NhaC n=1 Tax=Streptomyces sp. NPDC059740 TaxID=3346926 RepID=UPI00366A016B